MLVFKQQHPQDVVTRAIMLDYLKEIGARKVYDKFGDLDLEIFYTFTMEEDGVEEVDFNWEALLFTVNLEQLNALMNALTDELLEVEEQQGKIIAEEQAKKLAGGAPVDINLLTFAKAKLAEQKLQILDINGKKIGSNK